MKKEGKNQDFLEKSKVSPILSTEKDEDFDLLKILLAKINRKYDLSNAEILNMISEDITIPATIFIDKLSPLESVSKYLVENLNLNFGKAAEIIGKDRKTVWQAHKNANKKVSNKIIPEKTDFFIPISSLNSHLSILECVVYYLKLHHNISFRIIGDLLQRNERTIWTVFQRAKKKNET